jgi:c-di-GMP-binding flagellar brake protein YcgR
MDTNKRKHMRLPLALRCAITLPKGETCRAETRNISFGGVSVKMPDNHSVRAGDRCVVSLLLESSGDIAITFECQAVHITGDDIGFRFISIDGVECYDHFKNLMTMNSPDPDQLLEELRVSPGIIVNK